MEIELFISGLRERNLFCSAHDFLRRRSQYVQSRAPCLLFWWNGLCLNCMLCSKQLGEILEWRCPGKRLPALHSRPAPVSTISRRSKNKTNALARFIFFPWRPRTAKTKMHAENRTESNQESSQLCAFIDPVSRSQVLYFRSYRVFITCYYLEINYIRNETVC